MSGKDNLFKDSIRKTKRIYESKAGELINALNQGNEALKKLLIPAAVIEKNRIDYNPAHYGCKGVEKDRCTEKRICRCMVYNNHSGRQQKYDCPNDCLLRDRFLIAAGKYKVTDYEIPAYYSIPGSQIGNIDLIISDGGKQYATEVKPESGNGENLLRMIAEILTYTVGCNEYERAIAFFKGSPQYREYFFDDDSESRRRIETIIEKADIKVFMFINKNGKYTIKHIR